ncbi:uncharacterized protein LOC135135234 [Zophobas morio]|uniref:uncharacterized protein LOC135135234 n=1 Tax=Zophobas morio TaxID=2755281 RepID=UPI0030827CF7
MARTLQEVELCDDAIKNGPYASVRTLYGLAFDDGSRLNRRKLCQWTGFPFEIASDDFNEKVDEVVQNFTIAELCGVGLLLGLNCAGTHQEVAERICSVLTDFDLFTQERVVQEQESENEDDEDDPVDSDDGRAGAAAVPTFTMSFRDIEDSVRTFSGDDNYAIEIWVADFEDIAKLMKWSELQRLVFAKKSLTGLAKLFIQSQRNLGTWKDLKRRLLSEFSKKVSTAELHRMLNNRKMKKEESLQEYLLKMRELASKGQIEEESVIEYVIQGINDDPEHKFLLYEAKTYVDLKKKIKVYEKIRKTRTPSTQSVGQRFRKHNENKGTYSPGSVGAKGSSKPPPNQNIIRRCYNCNGVGHFASNCPIPVREKGSCYNCGSKEHQKRNCPGKKKEDNTTNVISTETQDPYMVNVKINVKDDCQTECSYNLNSLIDTGSPISVVKVRYVTENNFNEGLNPNLNFVGVNGSKLDILGIFNTEVFVNETVLPIKFYVVPNSTMSFNAILGRDFLNTKGFTFTLGDHLKIISNEFEKVNNFDEILHVNFKVGEEIKSNKEVQINPCLDYDKKVEVLEVYDNFYLCNDSPKIDCNYEMNICVKNNQPISFRPRRLSFSEKEKLQNMLDDLLERGIIRPSSSDYCSPIVLVRKKTGDLRLCVDYRELNKITIKDNFPTPLIEDNLDRLRNKRYFTTLDLKDGFHHVRVAESSIKFTSFITPLGQFEYLRMPFGLTNAPRVFNRFINLVFNKLIRANKIILYLDGILIATNSYEEHLDILKEVFGAASQHNLLFRIDKCAFLMFEISYLGYLVNNDGIRPDPKNVEAILQYPIPTNAKEVHRWALFLQNYDYELQHRPGTRMIHVDALSRANNILVLEENTLEQNLAISQNLDSSIQKVKSELEIRESTKFELRNGLVYRKSKGKLLFYVPPLMESQILTMCHDNFGHVGVDKTMEYLKRSYWFPSIKEKVKNHVRNCLKCITFSPIGGAVPSELHNIPKGNKPFVTIHIDHYGPLEKTLTGRRYIFEIIDCFTKFVKLYAVKSTKTCEVINQLENYFRHYSVPLRIVSDRGSCFTSNEFEKFVQEHMIQHIKVATGSPKSNGQIERINRDLTPMLSKLAILTNKSTGNSPSVLLFGISQNDPSDPLRNSLGAEAEKEDDLAEVREKAQSQNEKLQAYNKRMYDQKHRPPKPYNVGDYVMIKNIDVTPGINKKLLPRYRGPYEIKKSLGNDRYWITDVEGFQVTQIPFEGVCCPENMKLWLQ